MGFACCACKSAEAAIFGVGLIILLRWACIFIKTLIRVYGGTQVTTERYGKGSWAVVTGSTDGIGKGIALELAARGFNIVLISRSIEKLNAVAQEVQAKGRAAGHSIHTRVIAFDFADDLSIQAY
jgi:17beta-estradiol 17-dehydrogenase / very-long-chain 3-oxoacyl-CoA reductase